MLGGRRVPGGGTTGGVLDIVGSVGTAADSTGVGDPIVEELARTSPNIEGFKFTSESKQRIMEGLSAAIQGEVIQYPTGDISAELETFEYVMRPGGGVRYSAPEGMHDDCVCALALAVEQQRQYVPGSVSIAYRTVQPKGEEPGDDETVGAYWERQRRADHNFGFPKRPRRPR